MKKEHIEGFALGEKFAKSEFIEWIDFELSRFDIAKKENKKVETLRFLFLKDLMDKKVELKQGEKK